MNMKKLEYSILINAPREKVWQTMFDDSTYRQWTKPFHEASYFEGSWDQGAEIHFLADTGDGNTSGMYARIKENRYPEYISIEHLGTISNGVVDTTSDEVKAWAPAYENYTLKEVNGQTRVSIDMMGDDDTAAMLAGMWPKALDILKELCEQ
jgi:uncharacterized protein YndB with AHSA1/START domain